MAILAACGWTQEVPAPAPASEQGMASWYGPSFDGQMAASGEIFDQEQLTAAHRTLPFGTIVRVRRLDAEMSVVVRINDRGPFVESRIIDLSYAAARQLGATAPGLVPVALEILEKAALTTDAPAPARGWFAVQAGAFRNPDNARRTSDLMRTKFGDANIELRPKGDYWIVLVDAPDEAGAEALVVAIRRTAPAFQSAFVVRAGGY